MIPLYSTAQIREADGFAISQLCFPGIVLMENAALQIFNYSSAKFDELDLKVSSIGFICGKGNNGGDGFAAARHFANAGYSVIIIYTGNEEELSNDCLINFSILKNIAAINHKITLKKFSADGDLKALYQYDVIFDAMLGSGTAGVLRSPYKEIVNYVNKINCYKIAIDIPTGLNADTGFGETVFHSDLTVTLGEFKKGLFFGEGKNSSGEIVKGNIGLSFKYYEKYSHSEYLIEPEDAFEFLPLKKKNINKYSAGKVLTIAGSTNLPGAAMLSSISTLRSGAGSSVLAFPKSAKKFIHKKLLEVVVQSYEDGDKGFLSAKNIKELEKRIEWADVVAMGPGLGRNEETQEAVRRIIRTNKHRKIVIDADAIFALSEGNYKKINLKNLVLTPHHGEFANLTGIPISDLQKDILQNGKEFVKETGCYLVLKGAPTIIFSPSGEALINTTGNPGMAKFGTGDVLTGILAGMLSQQNDIEKAIVCGVYIHSLAADLLLKDFSEYSFTAGDIVDNIPNAFKFLKKSIINSSKKL